MTVTRRGIAIRIAVALALTIGVVALPESLVNKLLLIFSAALFLLMAGTLIFPWRKPDLLSWEFFGLFVALGIIFGVGVMQQFGWLPVLLPFAYRATVRAVLVIFEAAVLTGLVRVGRLRPDATPNDERDLAPKDDA